MEPRFLTSAADKKGFLRPEKPVIAVSGRSNVGKSSFINMLAGQKRLARTSSEPGRTRLVNYFDFGAFVLADLPGYGYARVSQAERARWGRLIESWFADPSLMGLGCMLVDARHAPTADDCTMGQWFKQSGKPFVVVANKLDKLKKSEIEPNLQRIRDTLEIDDSIKIIPFSAEKGTGRQELLGEIAAHLGEGLI